MTPSPLIEEGLPLLTRAGGVVTLTLRRPSPAIWQEAVSWLRSESKLPADRQRKLEAAMSPLIRSNLDPEALAGR